MGESLDADRIEANYDHGVLTVSIPVVEQAKPRRVEISDGSSGGQARVIDASSSAA